MEFIEHDNQTFENEIYAGQTVSNVEYHDCVFKCCDFSDSSFLNVKFLDCTFEYCNLSMIKLGKSTLSGADFRNCKMLGVNFSDCQDFLFSPGFKDCILDYASFQRKKMPKTGFVKSSLKEVSFSNSILTGSVFNDCNLMDAVFNQTDLTSVNFTTAYNYILDPELNIMKKAKFSLHGIHGLLTKYQIEIV